MEKKRYIPNMSYAQTLKFCDFFTKLFIRNISNKYKLVEISLPLLTEKDSSVNSDYLNRKVTFDNNKEYEVYELIHNYDNLMRYNYFYGELTNDEVLFSRIKIINRDNKIEPYEALESHFFAFEIFKKEEERNVTTCFKEIEFFVEMINQTCLAVKDFGINHEFKKIPNINASKISNLYPLLSDVESIENYVKEKEAVAVSFNLNNFNKFFPFKSLVSYDVENTTSLFVWCKQISSVVEIMDVTFRPNFSILESQLKNTSFFDKNNELYEIIENDKIKPTMGIKINMGKLFFYLLKKMNINELPSYNSKFNLGKDYLLYNIKKQK